MFKKFRELKKRNSALIGEVFDLNMTLSLSHDEIECLRDRAEALQLQLEDMHEELEHSEKKRKTAEAEAKLRRVNFAEALIEQYGVEGTFNEILICPHGKKAEDAACRDLLGKTEIWKMFPTEDNLHYFEDDFDETPWREKAAFGVIAYSHFIGSYELCDYKIDNNAKKYLQYRAKLMLGTIEKMVSMYPCELENHFGAVKTA